MCAWLTDLSRCCERESDRLPRGALIYCVRLYGHSLEYDGFAFEVADFQVRGALDTYTLVQQRVNV
jgi:hypothetical protein